MCSVTWKDKIMNDIRENMKVALIAEKRKSQGAYMVWACDEKRAGPWSKSGSFCIKMQNK